MFVVGARSGHLFLATASEQIKAQGEIMFGRSAISWSPHAVYRETASDDISALAEVMMLSNCSKLVASAHSTFGYVAHAMSGVKPFVVLEQQQCFEGVSSVPCMHAWRKLHATVSSKCGQLEITASHLDCGFVQIT